MSSKRSYLFFGLLLLILSSCTYHELEPIEVVIPDEPISYSTTIQPIFDSRCINCHDALTPILTTGNSYSNLESGGWFTAGDSENSKLIKKITQGPHSGGKNILSAEELAYLKKWIEQGAQNN